MKFRDFVEALYACGWSNTRDAQLSETKKLHTKLFPVVAQLENDVEELYDALKGGQK